MATNSISQLASCKASIALAASTFNPREKQACCSARLSSNPHTRGILSGRKVPFRQTYGLAASGSTLVIATSGKAKAASQLYELSLEEPVGPNNTPEQIFAAQDSLKDVADESQLSLEDVVSDAKERAGDALEGTQGFFSQSRDAVKDVFEDAQERFSGLMEAAPKVGDAPQDMVEDRVDELIKSLPGPDVGDSVQSFADRAEDGAKNSGNALKDFFERTQDRFESAQDAVKTFTDNITSKPEEAPDSQVLESATPAPAESLPGLDTSDATESAQNSGNALQDFFESTQDRFESAQDAVKAFTDNIRSKPAEAPESQVPESATPAPAEGLSGLNTSDAVESAQNSGNAVQDFFESTQDRFESAQDAVKAFTDNMLSKPAETPESRVPESPSPAEGLSGLDTSDAVESAQDSVQSFKANTPSFAEKAAPRAVEEAQNQVQSIPEEALTNSISSFKESAADSATAGQDTVSDTVDNAGAALESGKAAINDAFQDAQETLDSTIGGATSSIQSSLTAAQQAYQDSIGGAQTGVLGAVKSVQEAFYNFFDSANKSVSGASSALTEQTSSLITPLRGIGTPLKGAIDQASSLAADTVSRVSQEVEAVLPPEAQNALATAKRTARELSGPFQGLLKQALNLAGDLLVSAEKAAGINPDDPAVTAVLVGGGVVALVITWWVRERVGYGGDLSPQEALELLQKEGRALLVDVRPQKLRDANGIPALKRGARFKFASVDAETLDRDVRRLVRDASAVENQILAAKIRGLKNVGSGTTIVVMDDRGQTSKDVARAVARTKVKKVYRLDGGYNAWAASLATRDDAPEAAVAILKEEVAFIAEDTGVPAPLLATGVTSGVIFGTWAVLEWERTLQYIALVGIVSSILSRVRTYTSPEDFKADLRLLQRPFQLGAGAVGGLFGRVDKGAGSPQLATSTGTSADSAPERPASEEDEEYDDPVVTEEESPKSSPSPVTTVAIEKE